MIFAKIKSWLYVAAATLAVLVGAYTLGARASRRSEVEKRLARDAANVRKSQENRREVERMDDDDLLDEFDQLRAARREKRR